MAEFEYEYNQQDRELLVTEQDNFTFGQDGDYIRVIVYPTEDINNIVTLESGGINGKAVFYSSLNDIPFEINISPFGFGLNDFSTKIVGREVNDFKIYRTLDENGDVIPNGSIYIKPNEIFNTFGLPQGEYKIQIDFLNQAAPPFDETDPGEDNPIPTTESFDNHYQFIIKQISTSRKEIRLKLVDRNITEDASTINNLNQIFTDSQTNSFDFKYLLNIGIGDHIPIMNYQFDSITDGKDNQSIILKLYEPLPTSITNLSWITLEREVLTTQTDTFFYFSEVPDVFFGDGLAPDGQENWINPDGNDVEFQNYNELSSSFSKINLNNLISESKYNYPNLNTDFNEFTNHTFFGSAKRKLENFKNKVETIQQYYSEISQSLSGSGTDVSLAGDSKHVVQKRESLFNKVNNEINTFSPYERFLYFDGQSESTASAPGVGINYADSLPTTTVKPNGNANPDYEGALHGADGFDVVYHHSDRKAGMNPWQDIFVDKYYAHQKPFFNYSGSIYLSFLAKQNSGSSTNHANTGKAFTLSNSNESIYNGLNHFLPIDAWGGKVTFNPRRNQITGSIYQRFIFEASQSYWIPNTNDNDLNDLEYIPNGGDFAAGSTTVTVLTSEVKSGSYSIKDSTGGYPTTVVTQSGVPFSGSVMPAGELFRIYRKNELSSSLQSYYRFNEGSGTTALDASGNGNNGTLLNGATYTNTAGEFVFGMNRSAGKFALSLDGTNDGVELAADAFGDLSSTDFTIAAWINPNDDIAEFDAIVAKRADDNGPGFQFDLRDKTGENDGAHPFGIGFAISGSGIATADSSATIAKNEYSHVAAVVDRDANVKLYVNGVQVGSTTINLTNQGSAVNVSNKIGIGARIANNGTSLSNKFPGKIDEVRFYRRALRGEEIQTIFETRDGIIDIKLTDVKVTLNNPLNAQPFSELYHTSSAAWTNWYNGMYDSASAFDTDNIHSLENNLPTYIQNSSEYNDMKDFLALQGEQYDLIRNHIDSLGTLHNRGYKKTNSPPDNTLPVLLDNMGWEAINPFTGDLNDYIGQYLGSVTTTTDIKTDTWRKTLNNLIYLYKSKGTKNSVRALLNTYGYPPDVLQFQEFGGGTEPIIANSPGFIKNTPPASSTAIDTDLNTLTGSIHFQNRKQRMYRYMFNNFSSSFRPSRVINLDWWMDNANINNFEFVYKHKKTTQTQTILESSGSGAETLWDLRLIPSVGGESSSFAFRLNNSRTGSLAIATNGVSMSTSYNNMLDGQLWNVMVQRMTSSVSGSGTNEYRLHTALQEKEKIKTYSMVSMSVSGGLTTDSNHRANQNWPSSGSRQHTSSSNLFIGEVFSGSIAEIKAWTLPLSTSRFRQHTLNKFSTVGNTINSYRQELVYHFKLNENYSSASVSASGQNLTIKDSAPKGTLTTDYSIQKSGDFFTGSVIYGFDYIDVVKFSLQDNTPNKVNNKTILINPKRNVVGDLNPFQKSVVSLTEENGKPLFNNSSRLEIYRSPQTFVDNEILNNLDGFSFETLYGNPLSYVSHSYEEFETFRDNFFEAHPIEVDTNKFIRAHENMFNHSIIEGLSSLVPARSTFSDINSNTGVEIRQTILEKQKTQGESGSIELNPNRVTGSHIVISTETIMTGSAYIQPTTGSINVLLSTITTGSKIESPITGSISKIINLTGSSFISPYTGSIKIYDSGSSIAVTQFSSSITNPYTASIKIHDTGSSMGEMEFSSSIVNPYTGSISIIPTSFSTGSMIVLPKSGTIDYSAHSNKSFENIHDNYGKGSVSSTDVHFPNYAAEIATSQTTASISFTFFSSSAHNSEIKLVSFDGTNEILKSYLVTTSSAVSNGDFTADSSSVLFLTGSPCTAGVTGSQAGNFLAAVSSSNGHGSFGIVSGSFTLSRTNGTVTIKQPFAGLLPLEFSASFNSSAATSVSQSSTLFFRGGTKSPGNFNVGQIDPSYHFITIGDTEIYSGSRTSQTGSFNFANFDNPTRFYNRTIVDTTIHKNTTYESLINGTVGGQTGRMMGKTRYFITSSDGNIILPRNHVTKFSQPFKDRMYQGTQNITNSGSARLPIQREDYSSASFYSVDVTGGENEIYIRGNSNPTKGSGNKIIY